MHIVVILYEYKLTKTLHDCTLTSTCVSRVNRWEWLHQRLPHGTIPAWCKAVWNRRRHKWNPPAHHWTSLQLHVQISWTGKWWLRTEWWTTRHGWTQLLAPGALYWMTSCCCWIVVSFHDHCHLINSYTKQMKSHGWQRCYTLPDIRQSQLNVDLVLSGLRVI